VAGRGLAAYFKKAAASAAHLVLIDESGALLAPLARRTLARKGQTPVMRPATSPRRKVSMTGAISISPVLHKLNLYFQTWPEMYVDGEFSALFLRQLLHHLKGNVIVVWDRGPMHKGQAMRKRLEHNPRLAIEELPSYAPDCNPVEWLWKHIKFDELGNFCPRDVEHLEQTLVEKLEAAKADPQRLASFLAGSELSLEYPALTA
jgi:transposase